MPHPPESLQTVGPLPAPKGLHVDCQPDQLRLSWSQSKPDGWLALVVGMLFIWIGIHLLATGGVALVYTGSLLLGAILTYCALVAVVNQRSIRVTGTAVAYHSGPLPFEKNQLVASDALTQLYTRRMTTISKYRDIGGFTLQAILRDGSQLQLMSDPSYELVHYLECQIEDRLGIQDLTVEGEVNPPRMKMTR